MENTQFKSFIFPHNPSNIKIESRGRSAVFFCPGRGDMVQALGRAARTVRCAGSFVCQSLEQAAGLLEEWEQKTKDPTPGTLQLPGLPAMTAVLEESVFEATGDGRTVPYFIRFLEVPQGV